MKLFAVALLLALQQSPYSEVIEVRRHNVDVVVTDREGRPVAGLKASDFEVLEDGKPQEITNFAEFGDSSAPGVPATPAAASAPSEPPPRKVVLFMDEMAIHPATRAKFAESVTAFIEGTLRPHDEATVVRPVEPGHVKVEFTRDRDVFNAQLKAAIDSTRFRYDSPLETDRRMAAIEMANVGGTNTESALREAARRNAARIRERVEHRLGNLRGIVSALADQPGRKVIVVVSESLPAQPGREEFQAIQARLRESLNVMPAPLNAGFAGDREILAPADTISADYIDERPVIEEIARSAAANAITIYFLQPSYVEAPDAPGSVETRRNTWTPAVNMIKNMDALENNEQTMDILTEKTGGKWYRGGARVDDAFRQLALDVQSYYSMAYAAEGGLDQPHKIDVRVRNRPDLVVRARNEVVRRSIRNEVSDRVVASLVGTQENDLGIALEQGAVKKKARGEARAEIDVLVPLGKLAFVEREGKRLASFTVHYAISGERRDFVSGVEPEQIVEVPEAEFAKAQGGYWRYTITLNMRQAAHRVGVGVLDPRSQTWGIATVDLDAR